MQARRVWAWVAIFNLLSSTWLSPLVRAGVLVTPGQPMPLPTVRMHVDGLQWAEQQATVVTSAIGPQLQTLQTLFARTWLHELQPWAATGLPQLIAAALGGTVGMLGATDALETALPKAKAPTVDSNGKAPPAKTPPPAAATAATRGQPGIAMAEPPDPGAQLQQVWTELHPKLQQLAALEQLIDDYQAILYPQWSGIANGQDAIEAGLLRFFQTNIHTTVRRGLLDPLRTPLPDVAALEGCQGGLLGSNAFLEALLAAVDYKNVARQAAAQRVLHQQHACLDFASSLRHEVAYVAAIEAEEQRLAGHGLATWYPALAAANTALVLTLWDGKQWWGPTPFFNWLRLNATVVQTAVFNDPGLFVFDRSANAMVALKLCPGKGGWTPPNAAKPVTPQPSRFAPQRYRGDRATPQWLRGARKLREPVGVPPYVKSPPLDVTFPEIPDPTKVYTPYGIPWSGDQGIFCQASHFLDVAEAGSAVCLQPQMLLERLGDSAAWGFGNCTLAEFVADGLRCRQPRNYCKPMEMPLKPVPATPVLLGNRSTLLECLEANVLPPQDPWLACAAAAQQTPVYTPAGSQCHIGPVDDEGGGADDTTSGDDTGGDSSSDDGAGDDGSGGDDTGSGGDDDDGDDDPVVKRETKSDGTRVETTKKGWTYTHDPNGGTTAQAPGQGRPAGGTGTPGGANPGGPPRESDPNPGGGAPPPQSSGGQAGDPSPGGPKHDPTPRPGGGGSLPSGGSHGPATPESGAFSLNPDPDIYLGWGGWIPQPGGPTTKEVFDLIKSFPNTSEWEQAQLDQHFGGDLNNVTKTLDLYYNKAREILRNPAVRQVLLDTLRATLKKIGDPPVEDDVIMDELSRFLDNPLWFSADAAIVLPTELLIEPPQGGVGYLGLTNFNAVVDVLGLGAGKAVPDTALYEFPSSFLLGCMTNAKCHGTVIHVVIHEGLHAFAEMLIMKRILPEAFGQAFAGTKAKAVNTVEHYWIYMFQKYLEILLPRRHWEKGLVQPLQSAFDPQQFSPATPGVAPAGESMPGDVILLSVGPLVPDQGVAGGWRSRLPTGISLCSDPLACGQGCTVGQAHVQAFSSCMLSSLVGQGTGISPVNGVSGGGVTDPSPQADDQGPLPACSSVGGGGNPVGKCSAIDCPADNPNCCGAQKPGAPWMIDPAVVMQGCWAQFCADGQTTCPCGAIMDVQQWKTKVQLLKTPKAAPAAGKPLLPGAASPPPAGKGAGKGRAAGRP